MLQNSAYASGDLGDQLLYGSMKYGFWNLNGKANYYALNEILHCVFKRLWLHYKGVILVTTPNHIIQH